MPTGKKPSKQDIERGGFNPVPANPGSEKEQLGPAPEVPASEVPERMREHRPSQARRAQPNDVRDARVEAELAAEIKSRAKPGSRVDMARHWADYRSFLHIGRMFVGAAAVTLAILGYTFA